MPGAPANAEDRRWRRFWQRKPRRRSGSSRTGGSLNALRRRDLETVFRHYYGNTLPDGDDGREDAELVLQHMVHLTKAPDRMREWLRVWAPWLEPNESDQIIERVISRPRLYKADTLAAEINLTAANRERLKITTIGATDLPRDARLAARKERSRIAKETRRRACGAKQRPEYEANSANRNKPWIAAGISRRTWYRRQRGTGVATAHSTILSGAPALVP
jgi:hypothetical protein